MATRRKTVAPVEEDGDDLLPMPDRIQVPAKKAAAKKTTKPKRKMRRPAPPEPGQDLDDEIDNDEAEGAADAAPVEMEGLPQYNRRTQELEAQMLARMTGKPIFPFPDEITEKLKPQWIRLVNSFPSDHFQVSDIPLMLVYCQSVYDIERLNLLIEDEGEVVMGGRGQAIVNPRCKVRDSRIASMLALATKFRNQPASRVNTENFANRQNKAGAAAGAAQTANEDEDELLATPDGDRRVH
jgi:hypothetical protein